MSFARLVDRLASEALDQGAPPHAILAELRTLARREAAGPSKFTKADVDQAIRSYRRTHWGLRGKASAEVMRCADPSREVLATLGQLVSVTYEATKLGDPPKTWYEHEFSRPRPVLTYSSEGLVICGGTYRVEARGIVG